MKEKDNEKACINDSIVEKIAADTGDLKDVVEDTVLTFLKITKLNIWIN